MKKAICGILILINSLLATELQKLQNLKSFSADFTQTLTSKEEAKTQVITYKGKISAKAPQRVLWEYKSPVPKEIYINSGEMIIYEPKLNQAIIKRLEENLDIFSILKKAKKVDSTHFKAKILDQEYNIIIKDGILSEINFIDSLENSVSIVFSKVQVNINLNSGIFEYKPSSEVDIIYP